LKTADTLTKFDGIYSAVSNYKNIDLVKVADGTHSNVHVLAGKMYYSRLTELYNAKNLNK